MNISPIILSQKDIHLIHALHAQSEFIPQLDEGRHHELMRLVEQAAAGRSGTKSLANSPTVGLYDAVTVNDFSAPASNTMVCRIVLPHEADLDAGHYSVLPPSASPCSVVPWAPPSRWMLREDPGSCASFPS